MQGSAIEVKLEIATSGEVVHKLRINNNYYYNKEMIKQMNMHGFARVLFLITQR